MADRSADAVLEKCGRFSLKEYPRKRNGWCGRWGEAVAITITRSLSLFTALKEETHFAATVTGSPDFGLREAEMAMNS